MENISTVKRNNPVQRTQIFNSIYLYIKEDCYIKFSKVFTFPDSDDCFVAHIKIWNDQAPFYFVFKQADLYPLTIKGYKNCMFVPNMFKAKTDKKGRTFLACNIDEPNTEVRYFPIYNKTDYDRVKKLKNLYPNTFISFNEKDGNGEAFQIIKN